MCEAHAIEDSAAQAVWYIKVLLGPLDRASRSLSAFLANRFEEFSALVGPHPSLDAAPFLCCMGLSS